MNLDAILFDFDGVLVESEAAGNRQIAATLTRLGHPTSPEDAMTHFMGLAGGDFHAAIARWIGRPIPPEFHADRAAEDARTLAEGVDPVAGAVAFVRALPPALPIAICSSSSSAWIAAHLAHIGLRERFGDRIFSGREHVARGKPAPDLYLHAAAVLDVPIGRCVIIEDSPVGVTGAVASGAHVIGLCAGTHCGVGHADALRMRGATTLAGSFAEVARTLGLADADAVAGAEQG